MFFQDGGTRNFVDNWKLPDVRDEPTMSWIGVTMLRTGPAEMRAEVIGDDMMETPEPAADLDLQSLLAGGRDHDSRPYTGDLPPECADPTRAFHRRSMVSGV